MSNRFNCKRLTNSANKRGYHRDPIWSCPPPSSSYPASSDKCVPSHKQEGQIAEIHTPLPLMPSADKTKAHEPHPTQPKEKRKAKTSPGYQDRSLQGTKSQCLPAASTTPPLPRDIPRPTIRIRPRRNNRSRPLIIQQRDIIHAAHAASTAVI